MKGFTLLILTFFISINLCIAQAPQTDREAQTAISKLSFIAGNWEGSGWMMQRDGKKHEFIQTERVQFKLDSTVLLIEGLGKAGGKTIHNALAIISDNKEDSTYHFQSYLSTGRSGTFKAELKENKFHWYPTENMRFIIELNESGQWYEIGEMKRNGKWFRFFEMTLDKVGG